MPSWRLQFVVSIASARQAPGAAAHLRLWRLAGRQLGDEKEEAATAAHNLEANACGTSGGRAVEQRVLRESAWLPL